MGMSTFIQAFIPDTDKEYQKHKEVLLLCLKHDLSLPKETADYFGSGYADKHLLDEKLELRLIQDKHYKINSEDATVEYEVDLKNLPKEVTKIRFSNSW